MAQCTEVCLSHVCCCNAVRGNKSIIIRTKQLGGDGGVWEVICHHYSTTPPFTITASCSIFGTTSWFSDKSSPHMTWTVQCQKDNFPSLLFKFGAQTIDFKCPVPFLFLFFNCLRLDFTLLPTNRLLYDLGLTPMLINDATFIDPMLKLAMDR